MTELSFFLLGVFVAGVVRISFGRFVIFSGGKWVMRWTRFDDREQAEIDRVNRALETGIEEGMRRARAAERGK